MSHMMRNYFTLYKGIIPDMTVWEHLKYHLKKEPPPRKLLIIVIIKLYSLRSCQQLVVGLFHWALYELLWLSDLQSWCLFVRRVCYMSTKYMKCICESMLVVSGLCGYLSGYHLTQRSRVNIVICSGQSSHFLTIILARLWYIREVKRRRIT